MTKKLIQIMFIVTFSVLLGMGVTFNISALWRIFNKEAVLSSSWHKVSSKIESLLKEQTYKRNKFIDLYGVFMLALRKTMIGDFEFIKDEWGIMQCCDKTPQTVSFKRSLAALKKYLDSINTPLIFLQMPNKLDDVSLTAAMHFSGQKDYDLMAYLSQIDIDVLDLDKTYADIPITLRKQRFILRTDVHYATYAEFDSAKVLTNHLSKKYGIKFINLGTIFDIANWNITAYPFLGNTARSAGRFFAGIDQFEVYSPKFQSNLSLFNERGQAVRSGDFKNVVMNGYEKRENIDLYTYWVTNYGQWPKPYYRYTNNAIGKAPKILILADSTFLRGIAFLSLVCSSVTVVDTRYLKNIPYVEQALNEEIYDAVVITGKSILQSKFTVRTTLPQLTERPLQISNYWIGKNGVCLDTYNGIRLENSKEISIDRRNSMTELVGWAADFSTKKPLKALYIQIGSKTICCNYGIRRTSVSDHYKDTNLTNTGFSVTFPTAYFGNGKIKEIQFIQVGTDGTYRYEPVTYEIAYSSNRD